MISVVIPTLNEQRALPETLAAVLRQRGDLEVVVVDGGSEDGTRRVVEDAGAACDRIRWIEAPRGRARQMNRGAAAAAGDWLLFLHADTLLPDGAAGRIEGQPSAVQAGCFRHRFSGSRRSLRLLSWLHNRRFAVTRVIYGDQAMFIRNGLFHRLGGFPDREMEDIAFSLTLRRVLFTWAAWHAQDKAQKASARRLRYSSACRGTEKLGEAYAQLLSWGIDPLHRDKFPSEPKEQKFKSEHQG